MDQVVAMKIFLRKYNYSVEININENNINVKFPTPILMSVNVVKEMDINYTTDATDKQKYIVEYNNKKIEIKKYAIRTYIYSIVWSECIKFNYPVGLWTVNGSVENNMHKFMESLPIPTKKTEIEKEMHIQQLLIEYVPVGFSFVSSELARRLKVEDSYELLVPLFEKEVVV